MQTTMPMDEYLEKVLRDQVELFSFEVLLDKNLEVEIECGKSEVIEQLEREFGEEFINIEGCYVQLTAQHIGINACAFIDEINEFEIGNADDFAANFKFSEEVRPDGKHPMYNFVALLSQEKEMEVTCGASNEMMSLENIYGASFSQREEEFMAETSEEILNHGFLFVKALEGLKK